MTNELMYMMNKLHQMSDNVTKCMNNYGINNLTDDFDDEETSFVAAKLMGYVNAINEVEAFIRELIDRR